jgi:hypothetical protein
MRDSNLMRDSNFADDRFLGHRQYMKRTVLGDWMAQTNVNSLTCFAGAQESLKHEHQPKYRRVILPTVLMIVDQPFQFSPTEVSGILQYRACNGAAKSCSKRSAKPVGYRH